MLIATASAAKRPTLSPSGPRARLATGRKFCAEPLAVATARTTRTATAASLARVKRFWTQAPVRRPVTFSQVRTAMTPIATTCAELTSNRARPRRGTVNSRCSSPTPGTKKPSVLAKASATAATKPVLMARRSVHP